MTSFTNGTALFAQSEVDGAIAQFGPAIVTVAGKTTTEKRVSVVATGSTAVRLFAAEQKGKVGAAARTGLQEQGIAMITSATRRGNYKPLAEALSLLTAESVSISNRGSYESLADRFLPVAAQMENDGKDYNKAGKMTTKYAAVLGALSLIAAVRDGVAAIVAQENEGASDAE